MLTSRLVRAFLWLGPVVCSTLTTGLPPTMNAHGGHAVLKAAAVDNIRFESGNSALKIPFELYNNHIYLKVAVNGSEPLTFLLDTGSSHIIDTKQAKLGLKLQPRGKAVGVGEGTVNFFSADGVSFSLPGVSLRDQKIFVQGRLSFADRAPLNGRFVIDTGNALSLNLNRPFVDANKLLWPPLTRFTTCGIGGDSELLMGPLSALQLGKIKVSESIIYFSRAQNGDFANTTWDGNIGAGILSHFKVMFDYARSRMILESPPAKMID